MSDNRVQNTTRNIFYGYIGTIVIAIFSFFNRTVFIYRLGAEYLGISGLFTDVLGLLSFTELGIGSAMTFCLYKPIAEQNIGQIKALMILYKKIYRVIAAIVMVLGLALYPFIPYLVNTDGDIGNVQFYYILYLISTVSSYFVTYKYSFVEANQKKYIVTNAETLTQVLIYLVQIIFLLVTNDFVIYLIIQIVLGILQKIAVSLYINKKYTFLADKDAPELEQDALKDIKSSIKAMFIDKIGSILIYQTDNILISVFVNTAAVGLMSNYRLLSSTVSKATNMIFVSCVASLGNMFAKNDTDAKQIFRTYNFLGFWINGFVLVAFTVLVQPFIELWVGKDLLADDLTVFLYFLGTYVYGQAMIIINFRTASGLFKEDKWVSVVQAIVNLIVSVICLIKWDLPGVYIGTLVARLVELVIRPNILFSRRLHIEPKEYYLRYIKNLFDIAVPSIFLLVLRMKLFDTVTFGRFVVMIVLTAIVPNLYWYIIYRKSDEFLWLYNKVIVKFLKIRSR